MGRDERMAGIIYKANRQFKDYAPAQILPYKKYWSYRYDDVRTELWLTYVAVFFNILSAIHSFTEWFSSIHTWLCLLKLLRSPYVWLLLVTIVCPLIGSLTTEKMEDMVQWTLF